MTQAIFLIPLILDSEQFEDVLYANIDLNDVKNLSKIAKSLQIILHVKYSTYLCRKKVLEKLKRITNQAIG